jgi:ABC-type multidrug transport system ATPase subunit
MGASGSGKTSLLNILAKRMDKNNLKGVIQMNKKDYNLNDFSHHCGYVM